MDIFDTGCLEPARHDVFPELGTASRPRESSDVDEQFDAPGMQRTQKFGFGAVPMADGPKLLVGVFIFDGHPSRMPAGSSSARRSPSISTRRTPRRPSSQRLPIVAEATEFSVAHATIGSRCGDREPLVGSECVSVAGVRARSGSPVTDSRGDLMRQLAGACCCGTMLVRLRQAVDASRAARRVTLSSHWSAPPNARV